MHATGKTLEESADQVEPDEKAAIESALADLEEALKGDDKEEIEAKTRALTEASGALAQRMYEEQAAAAGEEEEEAAGDRNYTASEAVDMAAAEAAPRAAHPAARRP